MQHVTREGRQKSRCTPEQYCKKVQGNGTQYRFAVPGESQSLEKMAPGELDGVPRCAAADIDEDQHQNRRRQQSGRAAVNPLGTAGSRLRGFAVRIDQTAQARPHDVRQLERRGVDCHGVAEHGQRHDIGQE